MVGFQNGVDPRVDIRAAVFSHDARLRILEGNSKAGVARRLMASTVEVRAHDAGSFSARIHQHECPQQFYGGVFADSMFRNMLMK
jgi:hypothetical protein